MAGMVLRPPDYVKERDLSGPLIFLAGPIQGAAPWQDDAIHIIQQADPTVHIASPRQDGFNKGDFTEAMYNNQVDWETHYLNRAGQEGIVLFWLAKENQHFCERSYAQTSRFELGEWSERARRDRIPLVVGIEKGFTNERYIRRRLGQIGRNVFVTSTLDFSCSVALGLIAAARVS